MKNNNKIIGSNFEKDFMQYLANKGAWVHFIEGTAHTGSQPFDILTLKRDFATIYECKTLANKNGLFPIDRIEQNQRLAFKRIRECGNEETDFVLAILWNNDIYFIHFDIIDFTQKNINLKKIHPIIKNFYNIWDAL